MPQRRDAPIRNRLTAPALLVAAAGLAAGPLSAQEAGGPRLSFSLGQRIEATRNPDLATPAPPGTEIRAVTTLGFGLHDATPTEALDLDLSTGLQAGDGDSGLVSPILTFNYARTAANAALTLTGSWRRDPLNTLDPLDTDGAGVSASGAGVQQRHNLQASVSWGTAAPFGLDLSAGVSGVTYEDTTDPALIDSTTRFERLDLHFQLSPVLRATLGASTSLFSDTLPATADRRTDTLDAGLVLERTNGSLDVRLTAADTPEGRRTGLSFGRSLELPSGTLSARLGATRAEDGQTRATGELVLHQDLARGGIDTSLARSVTPGADDTGRVLTTLSLGYSQALSARSSLQLNLSYVDSQDLASGITTRTGTLGATFSHALTADWNLDTGYTHRLRGQDGLDSTDSDQIFMAVRRDFSIRP